MKFSQLMSGKLKSPTPIAVCCFIGVERYLMIVDTREVEALGGIWTAQRTTGRGSRISIVTIAQVKVGMG